MTWGNRADEREIIFGHRLVAGSREILGETIVAFRYRDGTLEHITAFPIPTKLLALDETGRRVSIEDCAWADAVQHQGKFVGRVGYLPAARPRSTSQLICPKCGGTDRFDFKQEYWVDQNHDALAFEPAQFDALDMVQCQNKGCDFFGAYADFTHLFQDEDAPIEIRHPPTEASHLQGCDGE